MKKLNLPDMLGSGKWFLKIAMLCFGIGSFGLVSLYSPSVLANIDTESVNTVDNETDDDISQRRKLLMEEYKEIVSKLEDESLSESYREYLLEKRATLRGKLASVGVLIKYNIDFYIVCENPPCETGRPMGDVRVALELANVALESAYADLEQVYADLELVYVGLESLYVDAQKNLSNLEQLREYRENAIAKYNSLLNDWDRGVIVWLYGHYEYLSNARAVAQERLDEVNSGIHALPPYMEELSASMEEVSASMDAVSARYE